MQQMTSGTERGHVKVTEHVWNAASNSVVKRTVMEQDFDDLPNKLNMLESVYE